MEGQPEDIHHRGTESTEGEGEGRVAAQADGQSGEKSTTDGTEDTDEQPKSRRQDLQDWEGKGRPFPSWIGFSIRAIGDIRGGFRLRAS